MTSALTCTCRRPSGGMRCGGIGAIRSPVVLEMLSRTSIVTGSPFATVSSSGASRVPSEYGLGGASTRIESRSSPIRVAAAVAVERARSGRPCQAAEVGRSAACSSGSNVASTVAPTPVSGTAAERRSSTSARISRTDSRTAGGMSRLPACSGSAGRRAPPGVVGPAATTSASPRGLHPARVEQQVDGVEQRAGAGRVRGPQVRRSEDDRLPGRRSLGAEDERGERVLGRQRRARRCRDRRDGTGDERAVAACPVPSAARAKQRVGEHREQRRRTRRRAAPPRRSSPVAPPSTASGVEHDGAGAAGGDVAERRLVEHAAAGPRGGLQHRRAEGLGDDRAAVGDGQPPRSPSCPRASATRSASAKGSATTQPPRAAAAERVQPGAGDLGTGAGHRAGRPRAPRSPAASPRRSRRGPDRRRGRSRPGRPNPAAPPRRTRRPARRGGRRGASDRARSSSTSRVCSPGTVGSRCGVSTRG